MTHIFLNLIVFGVFYKLQLYANGLLIHNFFYQLQLLASHLQKYIVDYFWTVADSEPTWPEPSLCKIKIK